MLRCGSSSTGAQRLGAVAVPVVPAASITERCRAVAVAGGRASGAARAITECLGAVAVSAHRAGDPTAGIAECSLRRCCRGQHEQDGAEHTIMGRESRSRAAPAIGLRSGSLIKSSTIPFEGKAVCSDLSWLNTSISGVNRQRAASPAVVSRYVLLPN